MKEICVVEVSPMKRYGRIERFAGVWKTPPFLKVRGMSDGFMGCI